jgi:hypothetical protein
MKDIFGEEPPEEVLPVPVTPAAASDGMAPQMEETEFAKEYKLSGISSVEEVNSPLFLKNVEHADIQEDEISEEYLLMRDWRARVDLRQAVIYSEILNRPYV